MKFFASADTGLQISAGMKTKRALRKDKWSSSEVTPSETSKGVWPDRRKYERMPKAQTSALPSAQPSNCSGAIQQTPRRKSLKSAARRHFTWEVEACGRGRRGCANGVEPSFVREVLKRPRPCLLAKPKSIIFKVMSSTDVSAFTGDSKSQFSGLMSLCTMSWSCKWATALAICLTRTATVPSLKLPPFSLMFMRSPPWQSSMIKYTLIKSSKASWSLHT
mmetsp:Transcript_24825/g.56439  ORF Transcript_24825/g.56439 Transcript_24825/m.56439 type:complete len:220 (-) Transcript_24825:435-1094(-)